FVANTFVPTQKMPDWLQFIAEWNPVSSLAQACRVLWGNGPEASGDAAWALHHPVATSIGWSIALTAICAPLALAAVRRRSRDWHPPRRGTVRPVSPTFWARRAGVSRPNVGLTGRTRPRPVASARRARPHGPSCATWAVTTPPGTSRAARSRSAGRGALRHLDRCCDVSAVHSPAPAAVQHGSRRPA